MRVALPSLPRGLWISLAAASLLVLLQQQLLERRQPRLLALELQPHTSGPGALDLRFSRPMRRQSLARESRLLPALAHRWLGSDAHQRLLLQGDQALRSPLALRLAGVDRRGIALPPQSWWWDPRPHLLVVARVPGGEQLRLRTHGGRWRALSPVWPRIATVEPQADGRGVLFLTADGEGRQWLWRRSLRPRSLARRQGDLGPPELGELGLLWSRPVSFAHLSSNRRGDLLIQLGGLAPGSERSFWLDGRGRRHDLALKVSGPIRLLPEGEGMVVPTPDGLELRSLRGGESGRPQVLPGSRVLAALCPATGQALLVRHWPDYRRSLERVQPGAAPLTLWLGQEAVMAASCNQAGDRAWMLLNRWQGASHNEVVALDRRGRVLARRSLEPWSPEPGTPLSYDPAADQLLLTLRRDPREPARAALLDGRTLQLRRLEEPISQAHWLPPG